MASIPGCRVAALCDPDAGAAQALAQITGARVYADYSELLVDPEVNAVSLCTPGHLHAPLGIKAANQGKHVLVEKPMAVCPRDAGELAESCGRAGVVLATAHQNRYKGPVRALKEAVERGLLGRILHGAAVLRWNRNMDYYLQKPWRGDPSRGGGVLLNQAIHNIDLLQWILGPVKSVYGCTGRGVVPITTEETAAAVLEFGSGALGVIEASSAVYPESLEETLAVFGSRGTVILGGRSIGRVIRWDLQDKTAPPADHIPDAGDPGGYRPLLEDWLDCIRTGRRPLTGGREGIKPLEIIAAIKGTPA